MQTLKLSLAVKSLKVAKDRESKKAKPLLDQFPKSRYFQVHFQHSHENARLLREELTQLKVSVAELDAKLEVLLARLC
jgi:hypothetical protein